MIYVDTTYTGIEEGTRSQPLKAIPVLEDGEEYTLSGIHDGEFNVNRAVKLYGDMLFRGDDNKAIRIASDDVEINGCRVLGINAHGIQAADGRNLKINGTWIRTDGYIKDGLNFQAQYPLTVKNTNIRKVRTGIQIQTREASGDLLIKGNDIADTPNIDSGCSIHVGDFDGVTTEFINAYIEDNQLGRFGENAIDLAGAAGVNVRNNTMYDGMTAMFLGRPDRGGGHNNIVVNNLFNRLRSAINTRGGYDNLISHNDIVNCKNGFWIDEYNEFSDNRFTNTPIGYRVNHLCKINGALIQ